MKIDAQVSKIKFEQEVTLLTTQADTIKKWGVLINKIAFPFFEAIFIPRSILKLSVPVELPPGAPLPPGVILPKDIPPGTKVQVLSAHELPSLSARAFGVRISLDDFDQRAPSVIFCDPFTWKELSYDKLFRGYHIGENGKPFNVILDKHPLTKKPFLCMRGIREYHEHPQHTGDDWMQYRKHCGLFNTIHIVWKTCVLNAHPNIVLQPPQILVNWTPEGVM